MRILQNGLTGFDSLRLNAPAALIRDADTTPAAIRMSARRFLVLRIA
jgi:hypothetical protein